MRKIFYIFYLLVFLIPHIVCAQNIAPEYLTLPFGTVRAASCVTGIKGKDRLYTAVQITPLPGWTIQDSHFTWQASDNSPSVTFIPFKQPLKGELIYPNIFWMNQNTATTIYSVQGTIRACDKHNDCTDYPIASDITLKPEMAFQTPPCFTILTALANTPKPWPNRVKGQAIAQENNTVHVALQLPDAANKAHFFTSDRKPFTPQNLQSNASFVTFDMPVSQETRVAFIVQTTQDIYEINLPVMDSATPPMTPQLSFGRWFLLLLFSFLFSPLLMVWGCHRQKTVKEFQKFDYYICIAITGAMLIGVCCAWFPNLWMIQPLNKWLSIALILGVLLWGRASPFLVLLSLIFLPKPMWDALAIVSPWNRVVFVLLFGSIWLALFGLQTYRATQIKSFLYRWHKSSALSLYGTFSTTLILLLAYTLFYL